MRQYVRCEACGYGRAIEVQNPGGTHGCMECGGVMDVYLPRDDDDVEEVMVDLLEALEEAVVHVRRIARYTMVGLVGLAVVAIVDAIATYDWHQVAARLHP